MWPVAIIFKIGCHFKKASVWISMVMMREKMVKGGGDEGAELHVPTVRAVGAAGTPAAQH